MNKLILLLIINCQLLIVNSSAQSLILSFADGSTESHLLSSVKTITYAGDVMNVNLTGGSTFSYNASTIKKMKYDVITDAPVATSSIALPLIYPNPTTGQLTMDNGQLSMGEVAVMDVFGRKLWSGIPNNGQLDLSSLPSGIYSLKTENGHTTKVVKEN